MNQANKTQEVLRFIGFSFFVTMLVFTMYSTGVRIYLSETAEFLGSFMRSELNWDEWVLSIPRIRMWTDRPLSTTG